MIFYKLENIWLNFCKYRLDGGKLEYKTSDSLLFGKLSRPNADELGCGDTSGQTYLYWANINGGLGLFHDGDVVDRN